MNSWNKPRKVRGRQASRRARDTPGWGGLCAHARGQDSGAPGAREAAAQLVAVAVPRGLEETAVDV
jgi:hypothetical protein